jgi:hypothetical protein
MPPASSAMTTVTDNSCRTLDLAKVPDKLHCPKCQQFLLNAFKGICCDSSVCEPCKSFVSQRCPGLTSSRLSEREQCMSHLPAKSVQRR